MKRFFSGNYPDILWLAVLAVMVFSIVFTLVAGYSPLEALGVSPAVATIAMIVLTALLAMAPSLIRWVRDRAGR